MKCEIPLVRAHRLLAPRPVCLVSVSYRGRTNVMTASWVCPAGLEPPLVMVAIHPSCYSHDLLLRASEFVLNVPARPDLDDVMACGLTSGDGIDKVRALDLHLAEGQRVDAPWLADCIAHIECAVVTTLRPGDHTLFIAEVAGAWVEEEAFDDTWCLEKGDDEIRPLCHIGETRFCLPGTVVQYEDPEHREQQG